MSNKLSPIHPGEVLLEEFIKPMGLSQNRLAIDIGVDARRINEICWVSEQLLQTLRCAFHASLVIRLNSGWGCSRNMILILLRINLAND